MMLAALFLISSFSNGYAKEQVAGGLTRLTDKWVAIERIHGPIETIGLLTNINLEKLGYQNDAETTTGLITSIRENNATVEGLLKELATKCETLDEADCVGITIEELNKSVAKVDSDITQLNKTIDTVLAAIEADDLETAGALYEDIGIQSSETIASGTVLKELIQTAETNLVAQRVEVCESIGGIADVTFFVFLLLEASIFVYFTFITISKTKKASDALSDIIYNIEDNNGDLTLRLNTTLKDEIGQLVEALVIIKSGADKNLEISDNLNSEVRRFSHI